MYGEPNPLIGKTIKQIYLSDDKEAIKFVLDDDSEITANCDAGCCSYTWIEGVSNHEAAIGSPVLFADDIGGMGESDETEDYEYIQYYGFAIDTLKGRFTIDYRNSSNGYYGGSLTWPGESHYGGVFNQNSNNKTNWKLIEEN